MGSVVITRNGFDIGLVAKTLHGKPVKILARYSDYHTPPDECPQYGGIESVNWYDTGIRMSLEQWKVLSTENDCDGFYRYWRTRLKL